MTKTLATILAFIASPAIAFAGDDLETQQMEIGTNFWDISWGGPRNQPFKTPWNQFKLEENPWNPVFLEEIKIYTCFRFMDWTKANSVERSWAAGKDWHKSWDTRTHKDDPVQNPVAYEWMIDLCNRTGKDMWITVPHVVDDDYVRSLAILIRDTLNPKLKCHVEWSNETWNGSFTQSAYVNDPHGRKLGRKAVARRFGRHLAEISSLARVVGSVSRLVGPRASLARPWVDTRISLRRSRVGDGSVP